MSERVSECEYVGALRHWWAALRLGHASASAISAAEVAVCACGSSSSEGHLCRSEDGQDGGTISWSWERLTVPGGGERCRGGPACAVLDQEKSAFLSPKRRRVPEAMGVGSGGRAAPCSRPSRYRGPGGDERRGGEGGEGGMRMEGRGAEGGVKGCDEM